MIKLNSPAEILRLLDNSNCGKCKLPTCSVFASSVFIGRNQLDQCPKIGREALEQYGVKNTEHNSIQQQMEEIQAKLKRTIASIDLESAALRMGEQYSEGKLAIKCLGKSFKIDMNGNIETEIHVNPWLVIPILSYVIECKGKPVSGNWTIFRDLKDGGGSRYPLFVQRCETPLKKVADTYKNLFEDMLHVFNGKRIDFHYPSDISVVTYPLPLMPVLVCYSSPEDGLESDIKIFFDETTTENLNIESVYMLISGMVMMFEKLALRHGSHGLV